MCTAKMRLGRWRAVFKNTLLHIRTAHGTAGSGRRKAPPETKSRRAERIDMTVKEFAEQSGYRIVNLADNAGEVLIRRVYCCDLLSIAMTKVPEGAAWVTVMSNINTLAVASLTEAACVIVAENAAVDAEFAEKAKVQGITVLHTEKPVFDAALTVHKGLNAESGI